MKTFTNEDLSAVPPDPNASAYALARVPAAPTSTPAGKVTAGMFDRVYRAAKAVEGATASGVNFLQFSQLLQSFASELGIIQDQNLTATDSHLAAVFREVLGHYGMSRTLWDWKIQGAGSKFLRGGEMSAIGAENIAADYKIPIRRDPDGSLTMSNDAPQRVWVKAGEVLARATALYYGR